MIDSINRKKEIVAAVILSLIATILSSAKYFSQLILAPPNHIFVGMSHYFEDFYYYLDQFYQGAHGHWLTVNNFTSEKFQSTFIYFNNILLGKIGGIFGLESFTSYNLSNLILKFLFFLISYKFITLAVSRMRHRIYTFILFLFSASFPLIVTSPKGNTIIEPLNIFRANNTFFTRFANIPSPTLDNIYFLLLLIISINFLLWLQNKLTDLSSYNSAFKSKSGKLLLLSIPLIVLLTISDPIKTMIFVVIFMSGLFFIKPRNYNQKFLVFSIFSIILVAIFSILPSIYMYLTIRTNPVNWQSLKWDYIEYVKQFHYLNVFRFTVSFGLLGIIYILGLLIALLKRKTLIEKMVLVGSVISIVGFITPFFINVLYIPGFRFILISSFLFMAIIGLNLFVFIEKAINIKVVTVLMIIYLVINLLTIGSELKKEITPLKEPDYHFTYLPIRLYQGLKYLETLQPKDAIVLGSPTTSSDLYIPGITGKRTYTGHFLLTYESEKKDKIANSFFYKRIDSKMAYNFLTKNKIKFIIVTKYSFPDHKTILTKNYPFLKPIFSNTDITILTY